MAFLSQQMPTDDEDGCSFSSQLPPQQPESVPRLVRSAHEAEVEPAEFKLELVGTTIVGRQDGGAAVQICDSRWKHGDVVPVGSQHLLFMFANGYFMVRNIGKTNCFITRESARHLLIPVQRQEQQMPAEQRVSGGSMGIQTGDIVTIGSGLDGNYDATRPEYQVEVLDFAPPPPPIGRGGEGSAPGYEEVKLSKAKRRRERHKRSEEARHRRALEAQAAGGYAGPVVTRGPGLAGIATADLEKIIAAAARGGAQGAAHSTGVGKKQHRARKSVRKTAVVDHRDQYMHAPRPGGGWKGDGRKGGGAGMKGGKKGGGKGRGGNKGRKGRGGGKVGGRFRSRTADRLL